MALRLVVLSAVLCLVGCRPTATQVEDDLGPVGSFSLTERNGKTITHGDLKGKVWVASFVFIRCIQGCPQVSTTMQQIQRHFKGKANFRLVTFTVDPSHDQPEELKKYAMAYDATDQWLFLTGKEKEIYQLVREGFHVSVEQNTGKKRTPGNEVSHSTRVVVVDQKGHIRGYYEGLPSGPDEADEKRYEEGLKKLYRQVESLLDQ